MLQLTKLSTDSRHEGYVTTDLSEECSRHDSLRFVDGGKNRVQRSYHLGDVLRLVLTKQSERKGTQWTLKLSLRNKKSLVCKKAPRICTLQTR